MEKNIELLIKEANAYIKQGLFKESYEIYKDIVDNIDNIQPDQQDNIIDKFRYLETLLADIDDDDNKDSELSVQDVKIIKEGWKNTKNYSDSEILESASTFEQLGLYNEALEEYLKLIEKKFPLEKISHSLTKCLFKIYPSSKICEKMGEILSSVKADDKITALINFQMGNEFENIKENDIAARLYESVKNLDPDFPDINKIAEELASKIEYKSRYDYLIQQKLVSATQIQAALSLSKKSNKSVEFELIQNFNISKKEVGKSLSLFYKCPFLSYKSDMTAPYELIKNLKQSFLIQDKWVPVEWDLKTVSILINDPMDLKRTDHINALIKKKISYTIGITEDIEKTINLFFEKQQLDQNEKQLGSDFSEITDIDFEEIDEQDDIKNTEEISEESGMVVRFVDQMLIAAYRKKSSDIHIEPIPQQKKVLIRFRVDGVCQEYLKVPVTIAKGILSRLKIMANLDIAEKRLPQDGKIKFNRKGIPPFELRLATLPTPGGFEDAVLRILADSHSLQLKDMGMTSRNFSVLESIVIQPYGLFLVVGPTGSGKTTSLHAALSHINKPGIKIWTAEDPIEITQIGLRQVEAKPKIGLDFSRIMRAFLRADPDVIMIGEMRDFETASIGIEASLTGHLVLSTLHTNSAPETITRLLDMGLNPLNFSDAFLGVLAQRLVRRLCSECKEKYNPTHEEFEDIENYYGSEHFKKTGITYSDDLFLYRPTGCSNCSNSGYSGRLGIHELLEGTKPIKKMIKKEAPTEDIFKEAIKTGMTTLIQDGVLKVFQGVTDIDEIKRVCVSK